MTVYEKLLLIQRLMYHLDSPKARKYVSDDEGWRLKQLYNDNSELCDGLISNLETALLIKGLTVYVVNEVTQ